MTRSASADWGSAATGTAPSVVRIRVSIDSEVALDFARDCGRDCEVDPNCDHEVDPDWVPEVDPGWIPEVDPDWVPEDDPNWVPEVDPKLVQEVDPGWVPEMYSKLGSNIESSKDSGFGRGFGPAEGGADRRHTAKGLVGGSSDFLARLSGFSTNVHSPLLNWVHAKHGVSFWMMQHVFLRRQKSHGR